MNPILFILLLLFDIINTVGKSKSIWYINWFWIENLNTSSYMQKGLWNVAIKNSIRSLLKMLRLLSASRNSLLFIVITRPEEYLKIQELSKLKQNNFHSICIRNINFRFFNWNIPRNRFALHPCHRCVACHASTDARCNVNGTNTHTLNARCTCILSNQLL